MKALNTQIEDHQHEWLRRRAFEQHASMAEVVRDTITRAMSPQEANLVANTSRERLDLVPDIERCAILMACDATPAHPILRDYVHVVTSDPDYNNDVVGHWTAYLAENPESIAALEQIGFCVRPHPVMGGGIDWRNDIHTPNYYHIEDLDQRFDMAFRTVRGRMGVEIAEAIVANRRGKFKPRDYEAEGVEELPYMTITRETSLAAEIAYAVARCSAAMQLLIKRAALGQEPHIVKD